MKPKFKTETVNEEQTTSNIAKLVVRAVKNSRQASKEIAHKFDANSIERVCENIYNFCRKQMPYKREGSQIQRGMEVPVIVYNLNKRMFDCKHYATFAASILDSLGIDYKLKMISQNYFDRDPKHIYVVAYDDGEEIVVDPCMKRFNDEPVYNYRYSVNFKK